MRVTRLGRLAFSFSLGWLAACAVPEAQRQLRSDVDAAMSRSDGAAAAKRYLEYRRAGALDDEQALRALAVGDLRDALRAADARARLAAIRAAERLDERTLFEPVTRLLGDDDEVVRATAAAAVLRGHADAPGVLTAALRSPNTEARVVAVTALGKRVGALAADDLRAALADPEGDVREAAILGLGPVADDADRARFVLLATRDPSGPVRARAVSALGPAAIETARAALADPYLGARLAAVDAVTRILGREGARPILAPLAGGPDLVLALHAAGPDTLAAAIRAAAAAAEPAFRAAAANRITDVRTADVLDALAADADPSVALAAARALARIGRTDDARGRFAAALGLADPRLRLDAAADLARLGDPRGDDALVALAADPDAGLRAAAAAAFPDRRPTPLALVALLGDDSRLVRVAAAATVLTRIRSVAPIVLIAVLGSAFLHAAWNAILKREAEPEVAATGVFAVCAVGALAAMLVDGRGFPSPASFLWSAASGLFEAGYILSLARALSRAPLGVVYTVSRGGSLVGVWPLSIAFLGEQATVPALAGATLVLLGLVATGLGQDRTAGRTDPGGIGWAVFSAANIAAYHIGYKEALSHGGVPTAVFAVSMAVAVPINIERLGAERRRRLVTLFRRRTLPIGAAGILSCASFLVFLIGLERAGAGAVLTLRNTSIFFAQLLALAIGERPTRIRFLGALVVAAGSILIGF